MSVNLTFTVDSTEVVKKPDSIKEKMGQLNWSDFAMGVDAVVAPAAEIEQLTVQFITMLGFGFSAERSMAVLRHLGDMAAVSYSSMTSPTSWPPSATASATSTGSNKAVPW